MRLHLDWLNPGSEVLLTGFNKISPETPMPTEALPPHGLEEQSPEEALEELRHELDYEILEMKRVLKVGGYAIWRSAGKYPWYRQR